jgi:hypothetical protein
LIILAIAYSDNSMIYPPMPASDSFGRDHTGITWIVELFLLEWSCIDADGNWALVESFFQNVHV